MHRGLTEWLPGYWPGKYGKLRCGSGQGDVQYFVPLEGLRGREGGVETPPAQNHCSLNTPAPSCQPLLNMDGSMMSEYLIGKGKAGDQTGGSARHRMRDSKVAAHLLPERGTTWPGFQPGV